MVAEVKYALVTTVLLLSLGVALPLFCYVGFDNGEEIARFPPDMKTEIVQMTDEDKLRQLAIHLVDFNNESRDGFVQNAKRFIQVILLITVGGIVGVWTCTCASIKRRKADAGESLGWFRWL